MNQISYFSNKTNGKSFTLIELLVVIAIIGLLAALIIPNLTQTRAKARDARRLADLDQLQKAMELYYNDHNHYPIWESGCLEEEDNPLITGTPSSPAFFTAQYLARIPKDPLPNKYCYYYKSDSTGGNFKIAVYLEKDTEKAQNDGGTASNYYEVYQGPTGSGTAISLTNETLDQAMPGFLTFFCGSETISFTYRGSSVTYGIVVHNSKCWLDRNLGASQVATAYNDSAAYGDLFQWGRLDDGHQTRTSGTTDTLSSGENPDIPGHSNFIYGMGSPYDWRSPQNNDLWQVVDGIRINNPCPTGWRLPTSDEWNAEKNSWSSQNRVGAFVSPLKLTAAGYRNCSDALLDDSVGSFGYYWSSSVGGSGAFYLYFLSSNAFMFSCFRADGFSVRCLKD